MNKKTKYFYCRSLIMWLNEKMQQKEFRENVNSWKKQEYPDDVYHFKVWKDLENGFFEYDNNLGLMLHFDFLNPFGRSKKKYSCGVIFFSVLNLPRHLRYKKDNIFLACIIPGPKEPKIHVNYFIEPIVNELVCLNEGTLSKKKKSKKFQEDLGVLLGQNLDNL